MTGIINRLKAQYNNSLSVRLIILFVGVSLSVVVVFTGMLIYHQKNEAKRELIGLGRLLASVTASELKVPVFTGNKQETAAVISKILTRKDVVSATLYDSSLNILYNHGVAEKPGKIKGLDKLHVDDIAVHENTFDLSFLSPITVESSVSDEGIYFESKDARKKHLTIGYLRIVLSRNAEFDEIHSVLAANAAIAFTLSLLVSAVIFFAVRKSLSALSDLSGAMTSLGKGDEIKTVPVHSGDEIGRIATAFNKMVGDRVRLEEQLILVKKLETVAGFAKGIAHDFNNQLSTIRGFVYILEQSVPQGNKAHTYTEYLKDTLTKMEQHVQSLLDFSKNQELHMQKTELGEYLSYLAPAAKQAVGAHIKFRYEAPRESLYASIDRVHMERVLNNLVLNARDAMPDGGELIIKADIYNPDLRQNGNSRPVRISVSDTGIGMDEETKERMFEPFFTTKDEGKGTGLGLSIVYGIIEQHKGIIDVDTSPGKGTRFNIYLPAAGED
ncbi:MAG: HAMP domain-containing protein [Nitrospirae bacterium]|nr:HAMP domain-containing protein [Nitrospirota bacterium]